MVCLATASAGAGPAPPIDVRLELGWSGWIVPGVWLPLRVSLTATDDLDGALLVEVPSTQKADLITHQIPVRITAGARLRLTAEVIVTDPRQPVRVRIVQGGREVARREIVPTGARTVEKVVAALTEDAAGLEFLPTLPGRVRGVYLSEEDLPERWQTYGGIEWLVIRDLNDRQVLPLQRQAIRQWVEQGGRLLVTGGDPRLHPSWLSDLLPATTRGTGRAQPTGVLSGVAGPLEIALVDPRPGASVSPAVGPPLVVRWRRGRGTVVLWTFDAFAPSLRAWPGLTHLWQPLLDPSPPVTIARRELATLLPSTRPLPGRAQAALGILSILYIIVMRRVLRRSEGRRLAAVAVVALATFFASLLYGVAAAARSASTALIQVSVVEAIPAVGTARVTTYASIVSPYGGTFGLHAPADGAIVPLSPVGLAFAGTPASVTGVATPGNVMFEVAQVIALPAHGGIQQHDGIVSLEIQNQSGLLWRDAALVSHRQVYRLPEIGPRLALRLDPSGWEPAPPRAVPSTLDGQVREWLLARLDQQPEAVDAADRVWLIATMTDPRIMARDQRGRPGTTLQFLLLPLDAGTGIP